MRIFVIIFFLILLIIPSSIKNSFELSSYEMDDFLDGFSWSMGITMDEERIYVADGIKNKILIFDIKNNIFLEKILLQEIKCGGHIHGIEWSKEKLRDTINKINKANEED